jgi:quinol monooxygenase YgiN
MIIVTAKMHVKPGKKDDFILKTQDLIEATRKEDGCISYHLYASTEDENILVMLEHWEDYASLNTHMETNHFKKFGETIESHLAKDLDVTSYSIGMVKKQF